MSTYKIDLSNTKFAPKSNKIRTINKLRKLSPQTINTDMMESLIFTIEQIGIPSCYLDMVDTILNKFNLDLNNNHNLDNNELKVLASFTISIIVSACGRDSDILMNTEITHCAVDYYIYVYLTGDFGIAEHHKSEFLPFLTDIREKVFTNFHIPKSISPSHDKEFPVIKFPNPMDSIKEYYDKTNFQACTVWDKTSEDLYPRWFGYDKYINPIQNELRIHSIIDQLPDDYDLNTDYALGDIPPSQIILPPKVDYHHMQTELRKEISARALRLHEDNPKRSADENWHLAEKRVKIERAYWCVEEKINENQWQNRIKIKTRARQLHQENPDRSADDNWNLAEKQIKEEYMMTHESYFIKAMYLISYSFNSGVCYGNVVDKVKFNAALSYLKTLSDNGNYMASFELAKYYYPNTYCQIEFGMSYKYFIKSMKQGYWITNHVWKDFLEKNKDFSINDC